MLTSNTSVRLSDTVLLEYVTAADVLALIVTTSFPS